MPLGQKFLKGLERETVLQRYKMLDYEGVFEVRMDVLSE